MTGSEVAQIITSVAALIGAVGSVAALALTARNGRTLHEVRKDVNGLQTKLVDTTRREGVAQGTATGLVQGRQEQKDADASSRNQ